MLVSPSLTNGDLFVWLASVVEFSALALARCCHACRRVPATKWWVDKALILR